MGDEVTNFDRDAVALFLAFAGECGVQPQHAARHLARARRELSEIRTQWMCEIDNVLVHAMRERDAYKENLTAAQGAGSELVLRVQKQANAISLALMALEKLTPNDTMGDHARLDEAKKFLREVIP